MQQLSATPDAPPAALLAGEVEPKLAEARAALADLQTRVGEAALEEALSRPGADKRLRTLNEAITAAERRVSQLGAALQVAKARDEATQAAAVHVVRLRSLADFEAVVAARDAAAKTLAEALATASTAYREFIERQQLLPTILPLGVNMDRGEVLALGEVAPAAAVAAEMYRAGVVINGRGMPATGFALPGAKPDSLQTLGNPQGIPAFADRVAQSSAWILRVVRDRVAALAPGGTHV